MPGGTQAQYHANPGWPYHGTTRTAFLPQCPSGRKLLKRLKYAWKRGLTFTIGTSLTTGRSDSIVWASIHHKTSLSGGVGCHGYPDPYYFVNCNVELDQIGVPAAAELPE